MDCKQDLLGNVHQSWQVFFLLYTFILSEYGSIILLLPTPQHQPYAIGTPVPHKQIWNDGYTGMGAKFKVGEVCVCVWVFVCLCVSVHV